MVDENLIQKRIDLILKNLNYLENIKDGNSEEEYINSPEKIFASRYLLRESIQSCLDIASHIIAEDIQIGADSYSEVFSILSEHGELDKDLAKRLSEMAKFRNVLVHQYTEIDNKRVYTIIKERLGDIRDFIKEIQGLLN